MGLLLLLPPPPPPLPAAAAALGMLLLGSCNKKQRKGASCVSHVSHAIPKMASALLPLPAMGARLRALGYSLSAGHLLSVQLQRRSSLPFD
jgi:hypothetical protein